MKGGIGGDVRLGRWLRAGLLGLMLVNSAWAGDWIEMKSPHFTLISEVSESRTRAWGVQFEIFRQAMNMIVPLPFGASEPVTLVLFSSDRRLRPFKPLEEGKPAKVAGYFSQALGRNIIALAVDGDWENVREVIFHEAVHWHLSGAARDLPRWMEEGLAELFGNFELAGNVFIVGKPRVEYFKNVRVMKPMPMAALMTREQLAYNGKHGRETKLFYWQSWAMMHALIFAPDGVGAAGFAKFINQTPGSDDPVKELEAGLGRTTADLQRLLETHLERSRLNYWRLPFNRKAVEANFTFRALSDGEADLMLGGLLICVGRPEEAGPYLQRAKAVRPDDPHVAEMEALIALRRGDMAEMETQWRSAFQHGSQNYLGHYLLAVQEWQTAEPSSDPARHLAKAVEEYLLCLKLKPQFVPALEDLGGLVSYLPKRSVEAEVTVRLAALRHPRNYRIVAGQALLDTTYGTLDEARASLALLKRLPWQNDTANWRLLAAVTEKMREREGLDAEFSIEPLPVFEHEKAAAGAGSR